MKRILAISMMLAAMLIAIITVAYPAQAQQMTPQQYLQNQANMMTQNGYMMQQMGQKMIDDGQYMQQKGDQYRDSDMSQRGMIISNDGQMMQQNGSNMTAAGNDMINKIG